MIRPAAVRVVKIVRINPMLVIMNSKLLVNRITSAIPDCNTSALIGTLFLESFAKKVNES
jgi:hypothetical protein